MSRKRVAFVVVGGLAVVAALAAAVALALVLQGDAPVPPASDRSVAVPAPPKVPSPPRTPTPAVQPPPARAAVPPNAAGEDQGSPALCVGCLSERAVLDVVETYLRHLDPGLLHGGIWAHPLADVDPEVPLPKLPPGLLDAPEWNPFGKIIGNRRYPVETTWIVWLQTGWRSQQAIENQITLGTLPEVARAWPPIKEETYVAVDGRTGELFPDGIFSMTTAGLRPQHPPHYEAVLDAARERAARWLREEAAN